MFTETANNTNLSLGAVSARPFGILKDVTNMVQLHKERRLLALLDADALTDIGLTKRDAQVEASRPVWDAPDYWHK